MTSPGQGSGPSFINPFKNVQTSIREFARSKKIVMVIDIDYKCFYFDYQTGELDKFKKIIYAPSSTLDLGKVGIFQDISITNQYIYGASHMETVIKQEIQAVLYTAANPKRKGSDNNENPITRAKTFHHENSPPTLAAVPAIDKHVLDAFYNQTAMEDGEDFSVAELHNVGAALPALLPLATSRPAAPPAQAAVPPAQTATLASPPAQAACLLPTHPTREQFFQYMSMLTNAANKAAADQATAKAAADQATAKAAADQATAKAAAAKAAAKAAADQAALIAKAAADQAAAAERAAVADQTVLIASDRTAPPPAPNEFDMLMKFVEHINYGVSVLTSSNPHLNRWARDALKSAMDSISSDMASRV